MDSVARLWASISPQWLLGAGLILVSWWAVATARHRSRLPPAQFLVDVPVPFIREVLNVVMTYLRLDPRLPWQYILEDREKYGRIFRSSYLFSSSIIIPSPEGVRIGTSGRYDGRKVLTNHTIPSIRSVWGTLALTNISGGEHSRVKRLIHPAMQKTHMVHYVDSLVAACHRMIRSVVHPAAESNTPAAIYPVLQEFTMTTPVQLILGVGAEASSVIRETADLLITMWQGTFSLWPVPIPGTTFAKAMAARHKLLPILQGIIDSRRRAGCEGRKDLLSATINAGEGKDKLSDDQIKDQMVTIMLAGYETTVGVLTSCLWYLAKKPHILEKLRAEQKAIKEPLTYEKVEGMAYLHKYVQEILRIRPPVHTFLRSVAETFTYGGYTVPKGYTYVYCYALQGHDCIDPLEVIPERWDDPDFPLHKPSAFTPFGAGEHGCLGEKFARLEIAVVLRYLVLDYTWTFAGGEPKIHYTPFMRVERDLPLQFVKAV